MTQNLISLIERLPGARVLVIGDAMLDVYSMANSTRQSPEAPVPVVEIQQSRYVLGGAANVAANMAAMGADVGFVCLTGHDSNRDILLGKLIEAGLRTDGIVTDDMRPTTMKERVFLNGAPFARFDKESTGDAERGALEDMRKAVIGGLQSCDVVVLSDYCKGVLPDAQVAWIIRQAAGKNIPVLFDSKKKDWACFKGALLGKPNRKELSERAEGYRDVETAARYLMDRNGLQALLVSQSEEGVMLITQKEAVSYPATAGRVVEVSGAGDTLLSLTALAIAAGSDLQEAVCLGNIAAGLAVEMPGTSIIHKEVLREGVLRYRSSERLSV